MKQTVTRFCSNAIAKDMTKVKVAFKILDDDESIPHNHQFVKCHMIYDVKWRTSDESQASLQEES